MTNANDPINVIIHPVSGECENGGLTTREYFAAMAMQGYCANMHTPHQDANHVAEYAVQVADSLIKHLNFETP